MFEGMIQPKAVNNNHFSNGDFPNIIGFCERDDNSRVAHFDEEAYEYKLHGAVVYLLKKKSNRWELVEFDKNKIVRVSADNMLENVLIRALTFIDADKPRQDKRANIIFPVKKSDVKRTEAIMYYLGGYPKSFLLQTPEFQFIEQTLIDPNIEFLTYSYVPVEYVPWLREELKNANIIGQDKNRTVWIYKK